MKSLESMKGIQSTISITLKYENKGLSFFVIKPMKTNNSTLLWIKLWGAVCFLTAKSRLSFYFWKKVNLSQIIGVYYSMNLMILFVLFKIL